MKPAKGYTTQTISIADQKKRATKDTLTLIGMLTQLPLGQSGKPLGYLADVDQGRANPEKGLDFARGLISGRDVNRH